MCLTARSPNRRYQHTMEETFRQKEDQKAKRYSSAQPDLSPTQKKMYCTLAIGLAVMLLVCYFCPAFYSICPNCQYTPTIAEAEHGNFCPECGTSYKDRTYCSNCGEKCSSPYCPHCGTKQENN